MATSPRARRWGLLCIGIGTLLLLGAAAAWSWIPVNYEAFALLKVSARPPAVLAEQRLSPDEFSVFKRTQIQLLTSHAVLNGTLREKDINGLSLVQAHADDPVAWLKDSIRVDYPDDAEIMRVSMQGSNSEELLKIVDRLVGTYMKEIVQHDRQLRLDIEAKLRRAYEMQAANYQRELDALRTLESIHKTSGSEVAQLKKRLATDELNMLVAALAHIREDIRQTDLAIELAKARAEIVKPVRAASFTADGQDADSLPILEKKREILARQLAQAQEDVEKKADEVSGLESFSTQVAAKEEELSQLRAIKNQLGAELDKNMVERLAPERIVAVEHAMLANKHGDAMLRAVRLSLLTGLGAVLLALGLAVVSRRPR